jgi:PleD family two-component response regulator
MGLLEEWQPCESEDAMTLQPALQASALQANDRPRRCTILLVEDEPFVRDATASILERAGYAVLPAQDACQAMKIYAECRQSIDLVMTDMVLPGRTG